MGSIFRPPAPPPTPAPPPLPLPTAAEAPRYKRMPNFTDPDILAAGMRTRAEALRRAGRLSTILTDNTGGTVGLAKTLGSGSQKLGA